MFVLYLCKLFQFYNNIWAFEMRKGVNWKDYNISVKGYKNADKLANQAIV